MFSTRFAVPLRLFMCVLAIAFLFASACFAPAQEQPAEVKPADTPAAEEAATETPPPESPPAAEASAPSAEENPAEPPSEPPPAETSPPSEAEVQPATPPAEPSAQSNREIEPSAREEPKEPRLRFNFRFQRWIDVLEWFATQADLSLVLDAPPPGTFNYSDTKEYTPTEAIDLLNGILLTKGYTLIRRERMLLVVNLEEGIPESMVPQVTLKELDERGRFEMVKVLFPLGKRNIDEVNNEILPLLSRHGSAVPLPKTNQLMVVDTAGIMRAIGQMIQSIPEPQPPKKEEPKKEEPKPAPPAPVFTVYPIKNTQMEVASDVLKQLVPAAKIVLDEEKKQINVHAVPNDHELIKTVLEQMESSAPEEQKPYLESYPLPRVRGPGAGRILEALAALAPGARAAPDVTGEKVIVWATPEEHETIKDAFAKLGQGDSPENTPEIQVYPLDAPEPGSILPTLQQLVPEAQLSIDAALRRLVVVGLPKEQQMVKKALEQLEVAGSASGASRSLKFYPFEETPSPGFITGLEELAPRAQITLDAEGKRLLVVATAQDHESIAAAVEEAGRKTPLAAKQLEVYPLGNAESATARQMIESVVPSATVTFDAKSNSLIVYAAAADQAKIRGVLDQLESLEEYEDDQAPELRFYELTQTLPSTVMTGLTAVAPEAKVTLEASGRRLMVVASPEDHDVVKKTLDAYIETASAGEQRFEVYRLGKMQSATVLATLQQAVPTARLTPDATTNSIVAYATDEEHDQLKTLLDHLESDAPGPNDPALRFYSLLRRPSTELLAGLAQLAPGAKVSQTPDGKRLMVVATPQEHEIVAKTLEAAETQMPPEEPRELGLYDVTAGQSARFTALLPTVKREHPEMTVLATNEPGKLSIWATPSEHAVVRQLLEEIRDPEASDETRRRIVTYPLSEVERKRFEALLPTLKNDMPGIQVLPVEEPGEVSIWGTAQEHERLAAVIAQIRTAGATADTKPTLVVYQLTAADPETVMTALAPLFSAAKMVVEAKTKRIAVWAPPQTQKQIAEAIKGFDADVPEEARDETTIYHLKTTTPSAAQAVLQPLVPAATITLDPAGGKLVVTATKGDHERIAAMLDQLEAGPQGKDKARFEVYPLGGADPTASMTALSASFPSAKITADPQGGAVSVWASEEEHVQIAEAVNKLATTMSDAALQTYTLTEMTAAQAMPYVQNEIPGVRVNVGAKPNQLLVWTGEENHAKVKALLTKVDVREPPEMRPTLKNYDLPGGQSSRFLQVLRAAAPEAQMSFGEDRRSLTVWARPKEHEILGQLIEQIGLEREGENAPRLVVYQTKGVPASTVSQTLLQALPEARYTVGGDPYQLIVLATPDEHKRIAEMVDVLGEQSSSVELKTYTLDAITPAQGVSFIAQEIPQARAEVGPRANQLLVWTTAENHAKVAELLDKLTKDPPAESAETMTVYTLKQVAPQSVYPILQQEIPSIRMAYGSQANQLIVWASPAKHQEVAALLTELDKEEPAETAQRIQIYTLEKTPISTAYSLFGSAAPAARIGYGPSANQLTVWARPDEHKKLGLLTASLVKEEMASEMVVYRLENATATQAITVLTSMFPNVKLSAGATADQLVVVAGVDEHERIKGAIEKIDEPEAGEEVRIYTFEKTPIHTAYYLFQQVVPKANVYYGPNANQLTVHALAADHEKLQPTVDQIQKEESDVSMRVYSVRGVTAQAAFPVLQQAAPQARLSYGAQADQIVAWARDAEHAALSKALEALDVEEDPEDAPRAKIYTLGDLTATEVLGILEREFPHIAFVAGSDPHQITARVRPSDDMKVEQILAELKSQVGGANARTLKTYTITGGSAYGLMYALREMVPRAQVSASRRGDRLIAFARPADHARIQEVVDEMAAPESEEMAPRLETYQLTAITAQTAISVLSRSFDDATFSTGDGAYQLVVMARPADHEQIKAAIDKLSEEVPEEEKRIPETYSLGGPVTSTLLQSLSKAFPQAEFTSGAGPEQLVVWARKADQTQVKAMIDKLTAPESDATAKKASVYKLKSLTASAALSALSRSFPNVVFSSGENPYELIAVARPAEHAAVEKAIAELSKDIPEAEKRVPETYDLGGGYVPYTLLRSLTTAFPQAEFSQGATQGQLIVWAVPEDQAAIKATIDKLTAPEPEETAKKAVVYKLKSITASGALSVLNRGFPNVVFSSGTDPYELVAMARPAEHRMIEQAIAELAKDVPEAEKRTPATYTVGSRTASSFIQSLSQAYPQAQFTPGTEAGQLVVWATALDHPEIAKTIDELTKPESGETAPRAVTHNLKTVTAQSAIRALTSSYPAASFTVGDDPYQLIVMARPAEHASIKGAIDAMSQEPAEGEGPRMEVYKLDAPLSYPMMRGLTEAFPRIRFTTGTDPKQLIVWAYPEDHVKLKELVAEMTKRETVEESPKSVVYELKRTTASSAIAALRSEFPNAAFSVGADPYQLIAVARPADHVLIKQAVGGMSEPRSEAEMPKTAIYSLKSTTAASAIRALTQAFPEATFTVGDDPYILMAMAKAEDHARIATAIESLSQELPEGAKAELRVYTLDSRMSYMATQSLSEAFPRARFATGTDPRQLIAMARPEDHVEIEKLVKELSAPEDPATAPTAEVYVLKQTTAASALRALSRTFPDAEFTTGADPYELVAVARPEKQKAIAAALEKMMAEESAATAPKVVVYPFQKADARNAFSLLRQTFDRAQFTLGSDERSLVVLARPDDHLLIKAAVDEIEKAGTVGDDWVMAVYPMRYEDTAALLQVLDPVLQRQAKFATDPKRDGIVVWASPEHQERIAKAIDDFLANLPKTREPVSKVYHFRGGDPRAAMQVLSQLVPAARMAVNDMDRSLVVSAIPEDHEKVRSTVEEMERTSAQGQRPELRAHPIVTADPQKLFTMVGMFFRGRSDVEISLDEENNTLVAMAAPIDQEKIADLVKQVEAGGTPETAENLEVYDVDNVDTVALMSVLDALLARRRDTVRYSLDDRSDQLVVIARPREQEIIAATVEKMRTEAKDLEILQLQVLDPRTAETAIDRLFDAGGWGYNPKAPDVETDEDNQQLFINATTEQHAKIRQLLVKMGETGLRRVTAADTKTTRVVPFGGDVNTIIEQIRKVWPELRQNPVRVVDPSELPDDLKEAPPEQPAEAPPVESPAIDAAQTPTELPAEKTEEKAAEVLPENPSEMPADAAPTEKRDEIISEIPAVSAPTETAPTEPAPTEPAPAAETPADQPAQQASQEAAEPPSDPPAEEPAEENPAASTEQEQPKPTSSGVRVSTGVRLSGTSAPDSSQSESGPDATAALPGTASSAAGTARTSDGRTEPAASTNRSSSRRLSATAERVGRRSSTENSPNAVRSSAPVKKTVPQRRRSPGGSGPTSWDGLSRTGETLATLPLPPFTYAANVEPEAIAADSGLVASELPAAAEGAGRPSEPVYLIPTEGGIMVKSKDPEALDRMEQLLRSVAPPQVYQGRNLEVFRLKHTDAVEMADKLESMFRELNTRRSRFSTREQTTIMADERLNAVIVRGSKSDRSTVGSLVEILDVAQPAEGIIGNEPTIVLVLNTDAEEVSTVVQDVFRSQLRDTRGSGRTSGRLSPSIAVNAQSNSLIIRAQEPLLSQIKELVATLDEAAEAENARGLKLIQLKHVNAARVQEALDSAMGRARRRAMYYRGIRGRGRD